MNQRECSKPGAFVLLNKGGFGQNARCSEKPVGRWNACFDRQVLCIGGKPRIGNYSVGEPSAESRWFFCDRKRDERT